MTTLGMKLENEVTFDQSCAVEFARQLVEHLAMAHRLSDATAFRLAIVLRTSVQAMADAVDAADLEVREAAAAAEEAARRKSRKEWDRQVAAADGKGPAVVGSTQP